MQKTGMEIIAEERARQMSVEGWTPEHDNGHANDELARAAACYAMPETFRNFPGYDGFVTVLRRMWPWASSWWKPVPRDRIRELAKAGALIAAEIDRLRRQKEL